MNLQAWRIVFRTEIAAKFSLRGKLVSDVFLQAFKLVVPLLTWYALFQEKEEMGGYNFQEMATYILIMNFIGFIFSLSHGSELAGGIKSGKLNALLLRPISLSNGLFAKFVAQVSFNSVLIAGPLLFLVIFLNLGEDYQLHYLALVLVALNLIFCFLFGLIFGLSAFWLEEVWPLSHLVRALIAIAGGLWFPLNLLPWGLGDILVRTPFAHLGYLNGAALMGKMTESQLQAAVLQALFWIVVSFISYEFLLKRGIRRYEAIGA